MRLASYIVRLPRCVSSSRTAHPLQSLFSRVIIPILIVSDSSSASLFPLRLEPFRYLFTVIALGIRSCFHWSVSHPPTTFQLLFPVPGMSIAPPLNPHLPLLRPHYPSPSSTPSRCKQRHTQYSTTSDDEKSRPLPCLGCVSACSRETVKTVLLI